MPYKLNIFTGLFDYFETGGVIVPPTIDGVLLNELGDYLITELGDYISME